MFAQSVFAVISDRMSARLTELGLFVESGYSFEDWCTWEMFAACRLHGWETQPKPAYSNLGISDGGDMGDLLVQGEGSSGSVLVELAIAHDWTSDKWIEKIDWDTRKLERVGPEAATCLQLLLCVSSRSIERDERWQKWLARTCIWGQATDLRRYYALESCGQAMIAGWRIGGSSCGN